MFMLLTDFVECQATGVLTTALICEGASHRKMISGSYAYLLRFTIPSADLMELEASSS